MAFLDLDFPQDIAAGSVSTVSRRTEVVTTGAGFEERNSRWADSRRRFDVGLGLRTAADLSAVAALWEEARGRLNSFRFRDWTDYSSAVLPATPGASDQRLGTGDGSSTAFQLRKRYGTIAVYWRDVTKPVAGSVVVALDDVATGSGWSVNNATGVVTFATPPASGVKVSAGFLFDVPVRFEGDALSIDVAYFDGEDGVGSVPEIGLVEVRE
ncbi:MAG: DUF2460 domain-containing protein [Pseudomonadota bacterium]